MRAARRATAQRYMRYAQTAATRRVLRFIRYALRQRRDARAALCCSGARCAAVQAGARQRALHVDALRAEVR